MSAEEIEELATGDCIPNTMSAYVFLFSFLAIKMRPGHRRKFPVVINQAREKMAKKEAKREREEAMQEAMQEEELEEKRKRKREKKRKEELASLEVDRRLAKAQEGGSEDNAEAPFNFVMPPDKDYFAFLSHKKNNTKLANTTETLALRVCKMCFLSSHNKITRLEMV
jgi:hypothetical protein